MPVYHVRMILNRRRFLEGLPALLPARLGASAEEGRKTRFYVLRALLPRAGIAAGPHPRFLLEGSDTVK